MKQGLMNRPAFLLTVGLVTLFMALERPAHAYLDPGSGSMVIQMVVAAVAGALLSLRMFWGRLKVGVLSLFARGEAESEEKPD